MSDKTFSYKGFCGSKEISLEDDCLFGKILFVNDLVTYEAESPSALKKAFEDAVDFYLEKCASEGVIADKPFSGSFNVRIPPELHRALAIKSANLDRSLNDVIRECIASYLEEAKLVINENHEHHHYSTAEEPIATQQYQEEVPILWTQTQKARPPQRRSGSKAKSH
jgi:predicted HicB family RNase H-like nuclease